MDANRRFLATGEELHLDEKEFADSLPIVALTCIDVRLNHVFPKILGISEHDFIWLRNSGNVIFESMSSMTRTIAMACAIKGGKEIAVIGHTDCKVAKTSISELLEIFKRMEIDRAKLPENLIEFFGLFASERQNVINGVSHVRQSPLIGKRVPVHGLLIDSETHRLDWLVNGYDAPGIPATHGFSSESSGAQKTVDQFASLPAFEMGEIRFPNTKIGEAVGKMEQWVSQVASPETAQSVHKAIERAEKIVEAAEQVLDWSKKIDKSWRYRIIGSDQKQYGPIPGGTLLRWLAEERIDGNTAAQLEGATDWKPLSSFANIPTAKQTPPKIKPGR